MAIDFYGPILFLGLAVTLGIVSGGAMALIALGGVFILYAGMGAVSSSAQRRHWVIQPPDATRYALVFLIGLFALNPLALNPALAWRTSLELAGLLLPLSFLFHPDLGVYVHKHAPRLFPLLRLLFLLGCWGAVARHGAVMHSGVKPELIEWNLAKLNRGVSYAALLFWPLMSEIIGGGETKKKRWVFCLLLGLVPLLAVTHSRATLLGVPVAVGVFVLALGWPRVALVSLGAGWTALFVWPWIAPSLYETFPDAVAHLPDSWRHRVEIWDYIGRYVADKPLKGWGLGAAHLLSPQAKNEAYVFAVRAAAHPHNVFSQLWVELGLWGAVAGIGVGWIGGQKGLRRPSPRLPFVLAAASLTIILLAVAYDLWTDSLLSCLFVTAFLFFVQEKGAEIKRGNS